MWHAEKWYRGTYLESRNGNPDVEHRHADTGEWVVVVVECTGRSGLTHTLHHVYHRQLVGSCWHREPSLGLRDNLEGWNGAEGGDREAREKGDVRTVYAYCHRADSLHCIAENNTTL